MPEARKELFRSALTHTIFLAGLLAAYYYLYDRHKRGFSRVNHIDDEESAGV